MSSERPRQGRRPRLGIVIAVAVVVGIVVWLLVRGGGAGHSSASKPQPQSVPAAVTGAALKAYARTLTHPFYWAGPSNVDTYELTRTRDGSAYLRYLPPGVAVGDSRAIFLTVGTYPRSNPFQTVAQTAAKPGVTKVRLPGGGVAVADPAAPKSVYLSYPASAVLVEVFTPHPTRTLALVRTGRIIPIR